MGKTLALPIMINPTVYWSGEFDNSHRHCWPDREGVNHLEGDWETVCNGGHNPRLSGKVEWMRFIHAVNRIIHEHNAAIDFNDENMDISLFGGFGGPLQLGTGAHDSEGKHWPAFELYRDWVVFIDNANSEAKIELHNEDNFWIAEKAFDMVQAEYER
jgi:hypothetical protein